ncbi:MAG: response regulator [Hyphomicrobium sp.]|jgi:two-component system response regulator FixJ|nr:response regulator transcription factor [Hyphomicrobium sp.]
MQPEHTIYVVDDDPALRSSLSILLQTAGFGRRVFASAEAFLASLDGNQSVCALVDVFLPGMTGLALQQQLVDRDVEAALIFMSGQADVPMAVQAMRAGASDFIQKPFDPEKLLEVVDDALTHQCELKELRSRSDETLKNLQSLTLREREVLTLLVEGNLNKMIAARLGISIRTVEHHRSHIMAKMNARTLSHLVRMSFGIIEPSLLHQK